MTMTRSAKGREVGSSCFVVVFVVLQLLVVVVEGWAPCSLHGPSESLRRRTVHLAEASRGHGEGWCLEGLVDFVVAA